MENTDIKDLLVIGAVIVILWQLSKSKLSLGKSSYKNEEEWSVVRNEDGSLKKIVVHRDAKEE